MVVRFGDLFWLVFAGENWAMHSESHTDLSIALLARIFQCSGSQ